MLAIQLDVPAAKHLSQVRCRGPPTESGLSLATSSERVHESQQAQEQTEFHLVFSVVSVVFILAHLPTAEQTMLQQAPPAQVTCTACLRRLLFQRQGTKIWLMGSDVTGTHFASLKRCVRIQSITLKLCGQSCESTAFCSCQLSSMIKS